MKFAFAALVLALAASSPVFADDIGGEWLHQEGHSKVKFTPCGNALCGQITWLKKADSPAKVGQKIFFDMASDGANSWKGKAFNPEDGKTYDGKMTLAGARLTTAGCVMAGMICKSVIWSRAQ
jgi:uncharacterized protein (DUF2147 family)